MGCVSSKPDINDLHPNIFEVMNINDMGQGISPGQLEVTETELVLHQRGKQPTKWPLRCLRKYGFDSEIFSFESGRRCPTGAGIYAFRCRKAEQLFNMLQHNIQIRNLNEDNPMGVNLSDFPVPIASTGPPVHRRVPSQPESYLNPAPGSNAARTHPCLSRPGSVTSNGPVSPPTTSPPPVIDLNLERNNNKRDSIVTEHSYTNTNALSEEPLISPSYINVTSQTGCPVMENYVNLPEANCHLYMNVNCEQVLPVNAKEIPNMEKPQDLELEDTRHCYANIDTADLENLRQLPCSIDFSPQSVPQTPTSLCIAIREVNYAELDLVPGKTGNTQQPPESPKIKKSYVTIDFDKTIALSQSVNPRMDIEEGSRKTRHNSTISDVPTRHSNSLSD